MATLTTRFEDAKGAFAASPTITTAQAVVDTACRVLFALGPLPARGDVTGEDLLGIHFDGGLWAALLAALTRVGPRGNAMTHKTGRKLLQEIQYVVEGVTRFPAVAPAGVLAAVVPVMTTLLVPSVLVTAELDIAGDSDGDDETLTPSRRPMLALPFDEVVAFAGATLKACCPPQPNTTAPVMTATLNMVNRLRSTQANPKKVFEAVLGNLLEALLLVRHVGDAATAAQVDDLVSTTLFPADVVADLPNGFSASFDVLAAALGQDALPDAPKEAKKSRKKAKDGEGKKAKKPKSKPRTSYHHALFDRLAGLRAEPHVLAGLPCLLRAYCMQYTALPDKSRMAAVVVPRLPAVDPPFCFLLETLAVALPELSGTRSGATPPPPLCEDVMRLDAAGSLLAVAGDLTLYVSSEDTEPHPRYACLQAVATLAGVSRVGGDDAFPSRCRVACELLALNHTLVCDSLLPCMRTVVQCSHTPAGFPAALTFMTAVVKTHARLRQVDAYLGAVLGLVGLPITGSGDAAGAGGAPPAPDTPPPAILEATSRVLLGDACMDALATALREAPARQLPGLWDAMSAGVSHVMRAPEASSNQLGVATALFGEVSRQVLVNDVNASDWHRRCVKLLTTSVHPALEAALTAVGFAAALHAAVTATDLAALCGMYLHLHHKPLQKATDFVLTPSTSAGSVPPLPISVDGVHSRVATSLAAPSKKSRKKAPTAGGADGLTAAVLREAALRCTVQALVAEHRRLALLHASEASTEAAQAVALATRLLSPFPAAGLDAASHAAHLAPHLPMVVLYADPGALADFATWLVAAPRDGIAGVTMADAALLELPKLVTAVVIAAMGVVQSVCREMVGGAGGKPATRLLAAIDVDLEDDPADFGAAAALVAKLPSEAVPPSGGGDMQRGSGCLLYVASLPPTCIPRDLIPSVLAITAAAERIGVSALSPSAPPPSAKKKDKKRKREAGAGSAVASSRLAAEWVAATRRLLSTLVLAAGAAVAPLLLQGDPCPVQWSLTTGHTAGDMDTVVETLVDMCLPRRTAARPGDPSAVAAVAGLLAGGLRGGDPPLSAACSAVKALVQGWPAASAVLAANPDGAMSALVEFGVAAAGAAGHNSSLPSGIRLTAALLQWRAAAGDALAALDAALPAAADLVGSLCSVPSPTVATVSSVLTVAHGTTDALPDDAFHALTRLLTDMMPVSSALLDAHLGHAAPAQAAAVLGTIAAEVEQFHRSDTAAAGTWARMAIVSSALRAAVRGMPLGAKRADLRHVVANQAGALTLAFTPVVTYGCRMEAPPAGVATTVAAVVDTAALLAMRPVVKLPSMGLGLLLGLLAGLHVPRDAAHTTLPPVLTPEVFKAACLLLYAALRHRGQHVTNTVPTFVDATGAVLRMGLMHKAGGEHLSYLGRVFQEMVPHADTFRRYSAYLLGEYVDACVACKPPPPVRGALETSLHALFDVASSHELQLVHANLHTSPAGRALFKSEHNQYEANVQYKGKV